MGWKSIHGVLPPTLYYALILLSAMTAKISVNAVKRLLWGGAAYLSILVAPALGQRPEMPGIEAAYLEGRQAWWFFTVIIITVLALWLIAFQSPLNKGIGIVLILIPHIIGTPEPEIHSFVNTDLKAIEPLTFI